MEPDESVTPITNDTSAQNIGDQQGSADSAPPTGDAPTSGAPAGSTATAAAPAASGAAATSQGGKDVGTPATNNVDPSAAEAEHHQNMGQKVLSSILGALGGTTTTSYARDPATGKMVVTEAAAGPGQQWKRIISGALVGAAAGAQAKGPGHLGQAAGAGFQAGQKMATTADTKNYDRANEDYDAQQKAIAQKAVTGHIQQETAANAWRMTREQTEVSDKAQQNSIAMRNLISADPNAEDLGTFGSYSDFLKAHGENGSQIGQMNSNRELQAVPVYSADGTKLAGVQIYRTTRDWNSQMNASEVKIPVRMTLGPDGKPDLEVQTIPAGTMKNGDIADRSKAVLNSYFDAQSKHAEASAATEVTPKLKYQEDSENKRTADTNATHLKGIAITEAGETAREHDKNATKNSTPVYAYDPTSGKTMLTTQADAQERNLTGVRKVTQSDISKDQHDTRVLNDVILKANNVRAAAQAMDQRSWGQAAIAAKELADNPNTTVNSLLKSSVMKHATPQVKEYIIAVQNLRESSMGLQKVLTGSARTNETQLQALMNTLPGVEPDSATVNQRLSNFTQNVSMLRQGVPELPGMDTVQLSPDTHVFSKSAWQAANPGKDVNPAIAEAQRQKFTVTN